ncbi:MAG: hypothetical protein HGB17_15030, partial [Syntrophobacteraceae bacterium]|nr:hypothetical protein [Syntrophobacteraceae bacterium]
RCNMDFIEKITRSAVATGHYSEMVKAVQGAMPWRDGYWDSRSKLCTILMRDFRIGIYTGDAGLCNRTYSELYSRCQGVLTDPDPFVQVCHRPFDGEWFKSLVPELQVPALTAAFQQTLARFEPDDSQLEFALDRGFLRWIPPAQKPAFLYHLAVRLLMGGRVSEARTIIRNLQLEGATGGLLGWLSLMEGEIEKSIELFAVELADLRKRLRKRNAYFQGPPALFFIFSLLLQQDSSLLPRTDQLLHLAESKYGHNRMLGPACHALRALYHVQICEPERARELLAISEKNHEGLPTFFSVLASYWLDNRLTAARIDALSNLFIKSREIGLSWFAMECAELLCRAERDTPVRRNFIDKLEVEAGVKSFVPLIPLEEGWRKSLRALVVTASAREEVKLQSPDTRLIWLVHYYASGAFELQPVEQRLSPKGVWTKGRSVSLARFYNGTKLDYISRQDQSIRSALSKTYNYYRGHDYHFDMEKALPALVGHPSVFLKNSPSVRAEVVKGEPEVTVTQENSDLRVHLFPKVGDSRVVVVQETPSRFKVIELTEAQRRMAKIIGEKGISIPEAAREEVLSTIATISSMVMVHSAIGGAPGSIVEVDSVSTPHVHLLPTGTG